jgi:probable phosphoglycerate mutase
MRLLLIRHGQTPSNVIGALDTATPGPGLTELGREQAAALPGALAAESIDTLVVSSLVRTHETAAPLAAARGLEPIVRPGIREIEAGDLEMRNDREGVMAYLEAFGSWAQGQYDARIPGGENGVEAFDRFDEVVREFANVENLAIVSHGAMIRYWVARASSNVDAAFVSDNPLSNTAVVALSGSPEDGWFVESWTGMPIGGLDVTDLSADGPAADVVA